MNSTQRWGLCLAVTAHVLWGLFPLYWNQLEQVASLELVAHRIFWAFVGLVLLVIPSQVIFAGKSSRQTFLASVVDVKLWRSHALAAVLIAANWLAFIYAINHGRILEASLGYYINPLFNVVLGVWLLGERMKRFQWVAVSIAASGVAVMAIAGGGLPWVSLVMASTFAFYGLVKKQAPMAPLPGLLFELSVLILPTAGYLLWLHAQGHGSMGNLGIRVDALLMLGGAVTITPLALFASGVRLAPLSLIGLLQYIGPTLQFLVGTFVFGEAFGGSRLVGFVLVWIGLGVFVGDAAFSVLRKRRSPALGSV